jgi:FkbM family methyltransferase
MLERGRRRMYQVNLANDRKMLVLKDDTGISEELALKGYHEPLCTKFIESIVKPGMTIIEAGANIGYYAFIEAELVGPEGFVYAIEPVPRNIECLNANIKMFNHKNVKSFQVGLGFENTLVPMRLAVFSNSGTMMRPEKTSIHYENWFNGWYTEEIVVEQWRLDDFRKTNQIPIPDLIRMDVEGYEIEIISGAQDTLKKMPIGSYLFIELHPVVFENKLAAMYGLLENLYTHGFRPTWCEGEEGFPMELKEFAEYVCDDRHCPHVFFIKGEN